MLQRASVLVIFLALLGCQPGIGEDCDNSADCSANGDRLCDITQPGGYCTIFNCEPGTCPEDSKCVLFSASRSTVPGCEEPYGASPYQRSFCMKTCDGDGDCRNHYDCVDMRAADNPWNAVVLDSGSGKVCSVPYSTAPIPEDRQGGVCSGSNGDFEYPPDVTESGEGGAGGESSGQGGMSAGGGGEGGMSSSDGGMSTTGGEGGASSSGAGGEGGASLSGAGGA